MVTAQHCREASGTATRARAEELCQSAVRDRKSPSDFVIGALVALEADAGTHMHADLSVMPGGVVGHYQQLPKSLHWMLAETVGAAGKLEELDGSWRLVSHCQGMAPMASDQQSGSLQGH